MHGRMLIVGAVCALAILLAQVGVAQASSSLSSKAATAAHSCGHYQLTTAKRSLSSANSTKLQKACATAQRSLTTVKFLQNPKHRWMIAPRYKKWWQVPDKKWRHTVYHARSLLRYHTRNLGKAVARIQSLSPQPVAAHDAIYNDFICIHGHEGAWTDDTGNGYFGGLQMDRAFMAAHGADMVGKYGGSLRLAWDPMHNKVDLQAFGGEANHWTPDEQIAVARRAGSFGPWPNTARACGLL